MWDFAVGKAGAYEDRVRDGVVFDRVCHYVPAVIDPADADVGGWGGVGEEIGLEGRVADEDAESGVAVGGDRDLGRCV